MPFASTKRFVYGGDLYYPGQRIVPKGLRNDRIIFSGESRYVQPVAGFKRTNQCSRCGRYFTDPGTLAGHQRAEPDCGRLPEEVQAEKARADRQAEERLRSRSMADIASEQGLEVADVRPGPHSSRVTRVRYPS